MIKQVAKIRIKFIFGAALTFLMGVITQINSAVPLFLISLYVYIKFRRQNLKNFNLLNMTLLFLITLVSSYFIIRGGRPIFYIPFCVIPVLATLLFNNLEISLLITLATAVSVASLSDNPFQLALLFLISGIISSTLVLGSRRRTTIIRVGFIVGIMQVISLIFIDRFWIGLPARYLILMLNGILSIIIVLGVLPVFEYLFRTLTNISLLELADFHHPLLQRMVQEAPGTHHHSLVVGNLSETA